MSRVTCHPPVPRSVCCGLETVRYITIQAEGTSAAIKVGKLLVKVALPRCDDSTVATMFVSWFAKCEHYLSP